MLDKNKIATYIKGCQVDDGGFSHNQKAPASGLDTYLATAALRIINATPNDAKAVEKFWADHDKAGHITDLIGLYLAVSTLRELKLDPSDYKKHHQIALDFLATGQVKDVSVSNRQLNLTDPAIPTLYLNVVEGEMKYWLYAVSVLHDLAIEFEARPVIDHILSLINPEGSFGRQSGWNVATAYYALKALSLLKYPMADFPRATLQHIERRQNETNFTDGFHFLEELHWSTGSYRLLGLSPDPEKIGTTSGASFIERCQRPNGGFAGAIDMTDSSVEFTYYAVTVANFLNSSVPLWA